MDTKLSPAEHVSYMLTGMKAVSGWPVLPHEVVLAGFMLVTFWRFCAAGDVADAVVYAVLLFLNVALVLVCERKRTPPHWRWRFLGQTMTIVFLFSHMKGSIPKIAPSTHDALLQQWDVWLIGGSLALRWDAFVHPWLTELLSGCYLFYFLYLFFSIFYYLSREVPLGKRFFAGLITIYGVGFWGYSLVPAQGPWKAMAAQFQAHLDGWWLTRLNAAIVSTGSNGVDVFPSLHCALSFYFLIFDRKHSPLHFKLCLLPCVGLWFSTIYLRYHYFIDVVCGFALSGLAIWVASWFPVEETIVQGTSPIPTKPGQTAGTRAG